MTRRLALALLLAACSDRPAPTAPPPEPAAVVLPAITATYDCAGSDMWDFRVDGAWQGLWLFFAGARLPLPVDSTRGVHRLIANQWTGASLTVDTTLATGAALALPCGVP